MTVSGASTVWTIDNTVVSFAKLQNISSDRLIGRDTTGSGSPEELTLSGGLEFTGTGGIQTSAFTGDVLKSAGGTTLTIAADAVALGTDTTGNYVATLTAGNGLTGTAA
ncbi:MAG: hypothetical protein MUD00_03605, partial [Candidatus Pacebacteria bacterium]|nr:hypothetical protein [Candidatus Paceibacterota bacterium]